MQYSLQEDDHKIDIITGSDFNGLTTFANLPYSNCFKENSEDYDIGILGAPFDTVSIYLLTPDSSKSNSRTSL